MSRFEWTEGTSLRQAVFEALGAASVCWENIEDAGVFQSDIAIEIGNELVEFVASQKQAIE
jgi:hypothetical protein